MMLLIPALVHIAFLGNYTMALFLKGCLYAIIAIIAVAFTLIIYFLAHPPTIVLIWLGKAGLLGMEVVLRANNMVTLN